MQHNHDKQPDNEKIFKTNRLKAVLKVYKNSFSRRDILGFSLGVVTCLTSLLILRFGFDVNSDTIKKLVGINPVKVRDEVQKIEQKEKLEITREVIVRAWLDQDFKANLLKNPEKVISEIDLGFVKNEEFKLVFVENTPKKHNLTVCTLCSCYPLNLLGTPPSWYKSFEYRAKAVYEPKELLREFGVEIGKKKLVVNDSDRHTRYVVLPLPPQNVEISEENKNNLKNMIGRDHIIGTAVF